VFLRVHGKHLAATAFGQLFLDLFDQSPFLGIQLVFSEVASLGNDESNVVFDFGSNSVPYNVPKPKDGPDRAVEY